MVSNSTSGALCYHCKKPLQLPEGPVGRKETCPSCLNDVRVCYNCKNYDAKAYNECREVQADRVVDKAKSNFCDYFSLGGNGGGGADSTREDALKKLNDLFK